MSLRKSKLESSNIDGVRLNFFESVLEMLELYCIIIWESCIYKKQSAKIKYEKQKMKYEKCNYRVGL